MDLNRKIEFIYNRDSKCNIIKEPTEKLLDIYPYPIEHEEYPPYWKDVESISLKADNIGIIIRIFITYNLGMRGIIITNFIFIKDFEYVDKFKNTHTISGGCAVIGDDKGSLIDLFVECEEEDLKDFSENDEIVFIGGKSYHNGKYSMVIVYIYILGKRVMLITSYNYVYVIPKDKTKLTIKENYAYPNEDNVENQDENVDEDEPLPKRRKSLI